MGVLFEDVLFSQQFNKTLSKTYWSESIDGALKSDYDSALSLLLLAQEEAHRRGDEIWLSQIEKQRVETLLRLDRIREASDLLIEQMANQKENVSAADSLYNELLYAKIEYHSGSVLNSYRRSMELFESVEQLDDVEISSNFYLHLAQIFNLANLDDQVKVLLDKIEGFNDVSEEIRMRSSMLLLDLYRRSEGQQKVIVLAQDLHKSIQDMGFTTLLPEMYLLYADISIDKGDLLQAQNHLIKCMEIAEKIGYGRYSPALFRLGNLLSDDKPSEALILVNSALSSPQYSLRDSEGFSHLNSAMSLYNNAKKMNDQEHELFFDRFRELSRVKISLAAEYARIRSEQGSDNILNDSQSESNGRAFRVVLTFIIGAILLIIVLMALRLAMIKSKTRKNKLNFTEVLGQVENKRFFIDKIKIEKSIDKKLNRTDWQILELLSQDHLMTNKVLAEKVNKSEEGISSSLRKMYALFHIEVTSNKKVALMNKLSLISAKKAVINVQDAQDVQSE